MLGAVLEARGKPRDAANAYSAGGEARSAGPPGVRRSTRCQTKAAMAGVPAEYTNIEGATR